MTQGRQDRKLLVVGFCFQGASVLLVQKNKPSWQVGLWNGVGGRYEEQDGFPEQAQVREFEEETGIPTKAGEWTHFCTETGSDYCLYCFKWFRPGEEEAVPSVNDIGERLRWWPLRLLGATQLIGNLRWLIPLAKDWRNISPVEVWSTKSNISERPTW